MPLVFFIEKAEMIHRVIVNARMRTDFARK